SWYAARTSPRSSTSTAFASNRTTLAPVSLGKNVFTSRTALATSLDQNGLRQRGTSPTSNTVVSTTAAPARLHIATMCSRFASQPATISDRRSGKLAIVLRSLTPPSNTTTAG